MVYIFQKLIWFPFVLAVKIFLKFNVKGQKNFRKLKTNKYIIVANHLGFLDAYLVSASIPFFHFLKTSFRYMMKPKWFTIYPFVRWFGAYPVYRKQGSLEKTLESTEEYIKKGKNILIFPEGTFPKEGERPKPKQGIVYLSKKYNLPILPIALKGSDGLNGDGKLDFKKVFSRKYRVNIEVGEPFYYNEIADDNTDWQDAAKKIMDRVNTML
jgi:1-acyl-sn-glycerol-3-phosphate acyltransferase